MQQQLRRAGGSGSWWLAWRVLFALAALISVGCLLVVANPLSPAQLVPEQAQPTSATLDPRFLARIQQQQEFHRAQSASDAANGNHSNIQ